MESKGCIRRGSTLRPVHRFAGQRGRYPPRKLDRGLLVHGSGGTVRTPKSTLKALRTFVLEDGPPPDELVEVRLISEFGWTFEELDSADESRALRLLAARNIEAALNQVKGAIQQHRPQTVPESAWQLYKLAADADEDD